MTLPLFEETYSVSRLCEEVRSFLNEAFSSVWVVGEVQRLRQHRSGHLYFELVEKDDGEGVRAKLDAVLWRGDRQRVERVLGAGEGLAEGVEARVRGNLDFYAPFGRMQLVVREVDPVFTLGNLERQRRETLAALAAAGLVERNRALPLAAVPLSVALVTSQGSAAYHDFLATLSESGYGFRVLLLHAAVQGAGAERQLVSALAEAGRAGVDCVALVRGGGSRTDLAVFDRRSVAEAVARSPVPVLTGLGHEIDLAIADAVAHTALKTPTKVAELLVERVARADRQCDEARRGLARAAAESLRDARTGLAGAERGVEIARLRLRSTAARLAEHGRALARLGRSRLSAAEHRRSELARRLAATAPRLLARRTGEPERAAAALARAAGGQLGAARATLNGLERLCAQLSPRRTLERGYSITRDEAGRVLREPAAVAAGDRVVTTLSGGELTSRVEAP